MTCVWVTFFFSIYFKLQILEIFFPEVNLIYGSTAFDICTMKADVI